MSFEKEETSYPIEKKKTRQIEKPVAQMRDIELVEKRGIVPAQFYKKVRTGIQYFFGKKSNDNNDKKIIPDSPRRQPLV